MLNKYWHVSVPPVVIISYLSRMCRDFNGRDANVHRHISMWWLNKSKKKVPKNNIFCADPDPDQSFHYDAEPCLTVTPELS